MLTKPPKFEQGFNTQPPEGGWLRWQVVVSHLKKSFNTQPPEGGWHSWEDMHEWLKWFQHTAARRRLAVGHLCQRRIIAGFNTQPPEGGWTYTP